MPSRLIQYKTILNAKAATGVDKTNGFDVKDWQHCVATVATASSANLTVKCQGSAAQTAPDFTATASVSNPHSNIGMYNYEDAVLVEGDTGVVFTGTDGVRTYLVNIDGLSWLNFNVTARSAGSVTVTLTLFNNQ